MIGVRFSLPAPTSPERHKMANHRHTSNASVFMDDTLKTTGLQRPNLVFVCTYLVRTKRAKNVAQAIKMLDSGEVNAQEIEELIIQSFQTESKKSEPEVTTTEEN